VEGGGEENDWLNLKVEVELEGFKLLLLLPRVDFGARNGGDGDGVDEDEEGDECERGMDE